MLVYKAAYRWELGVCLGEVLDFPGTVSFGHTLEEARKSLAGALEDMAETNLIQGEALPIQIPPRLIPSLKLKNPSTLSFMRATKSACR